MTQEIKITVRLFGAFRKFHASPVMMSLPLGSSVADVKASLGIALKTLNPLFTDQDLLDKSALADNRAVLSPATRLQQDCDLAILPPVCGG